MRSESLENGAFGPVLWICPVYPSLHPDKSLNLFLSFSCIGSRSTAFGVCKDFPSRPDDLVGVSWTLLMANLSLDSVS